MNKQSMLYTVVFVFAVSFVFVLLLSVTNHATVDQIRLNQELARQRAVLSALGMEAQGDQAIQQAYAQVKADPESGLYVYDSESGRLYAKQFAGAGLWGTIEGVVAVNADLTRFAGLEIVSHNETPGLGGRIDEPVFKSQFRGIEIPTDGFVVRKASAEGSAPEGAVDGITGATRTSDAMQVIINNQLNELRDPDTQQALRRIASEGGAE
jgi:Na+-transporting NADH:ubiquinone oxidoreductase subunit C